MVGEAAGWRVIVEVEPEDLELVSDRLFAWGALGIEERAAISDRVLLLAGMPDEAGAVAAAGAFDGARVEPVADDGWADEWRAWARPVRVGDVVVQPAWLPLEPDVANGDARVVFIDPGRAFGSGAHATTRLALTELLERSRGAHVLDVGCGSGVLAVAVARARGASVVAIDIDPLGVAATRANAARNGVAHLVEASTTSVTAIDGPFDVVVANILAVTLRELAPDLARVVAPHGVVVLSGMLAGQADAVSERYAAFGMGELERRFDGGWAACSYVPSAPGQPRR
jgi:ribosomal protein L11 methyltransferase